MSLFACSPAPKSNMAAATASRPNNPLSWFKCICERPSTKILCPYCGYTAHGRVRRTCPRHPLVTYLMDLTQCPACFRECSEVEYDKSTNIPNLEPNRSARNSNYFRGNSPLINYTAASMGMNSYDKENGDKQYGNKIKRKKI